ncbi:MAG: TauD/TfdA family dioxygenase [Frankiales bacterium]|nr:TauD/TfdA family dioxygenase [Frankiales bacterium]
MHVTTLDPCGARVTEVRLPDVAVVAELKQLLAEHGVLVLPHQHLDDEAFVAFLRSFGDLTFTEGETPVDGWPDLNVVSNVGRTTPPRSTFHVDTSYVRHPPAYTALRAVTIPARGGQTLFSNQYRAYDSLPDELRARVEGRTIRHVVTGLTLDEQQESAAEHPVFRPHPVTGRTSLFLSTPARCVAVSGLDPEQGQQAVRELFEHSTAPENVYRHPWSPGDVVIWDNACVMHRADHADVDGDRVMHRGMVARH